MKNLGYYRFRTLNAIGGCLERLSRDNGYKVARFVYIFLSKFLEFLLPIEVHAIVSNSEYVELHSSSKEIILKKNRLGYAANAVVAGGGEEQILKEVPLPPLCLYCHRDVYVRHSSDHIINHNERLIINDYCANNNNDNNVYKDKITLFYKQRLAIIRKQKHVRELKCGIKIGGKFSFNYYHDVYEHLIRLVVLSENNKLVAREVPIIIDEEILNTPSLKCIYDILSKDLGRETIVLRKDGCMFVHNLYYVSDVNYLVPEHIDYTKGLIDDYVFDKELTLKFRNSLLPYREDSIFPKRFFITRRNTKHRHFNEDELFAILEPFGFQKVAPEELSFKQQMSLFHDAEWIVGGSGAAFTNLLFTSSKCVIVCVFRNSKYISPVFTAPVCFNDAHMYYFQSCKGNSVMKAHTDFTIDVEDFRQFVNDFILPYILKKEN